MTKSKIDDLKELFDELFSKGYSDYKIAKELNLNHCTVFQYRKKHGITRESLRENKAIPITRDNMEVLLGTILGDSIIRISRGSKNPSFSCEHSIKQTDYCKYKGDLLSNLNPKVIYNKRKTPDPRNGLYYESCLLRLPANPELLKLYNAFYPNGKKVIPIELIKEHFSAKSLAILYMDDGNKMANGYAISTNCFSEEEILNFRKFLFEKFDLETSMFKNHVLYIKAISAKRFKSLILPYIHKSMLYKLH